MLLYSSLNQSHEMKFQQCKTTGSWNFLFQTNTRIANRQQTAVNSRLNQVLRVVRYAVA
uniref:Uncharacterized protein n=1 Tax=Anguilla anguilla TaxID=7936 RepID=A0A0E9XAT4_ANGAN